MTARICKIADVRRHGDNLTIVTVADGDVTHEVVANLQEDGTPRWEKDEIVVYLSEGSIVPDDVLQERHYWSDGKGELGGNKGNRVKMRRFAGFESRGLLFKLRTESGDVLHVDRGDRTTPFRQERIVSLGDDVSEFLGIVEHAA